MKLEMKLRVVAISDSHNHHRRIRVPDGDVLLHTGDVSENGTLEELEVFLAWFAAQPHRIKCFCPGNHDMLFDQLPVESRWIIPQGVTFLHDEALVLDNGLKVWGSGWNTTPGDWAFAVRPGPAIAEKWALIPEDTDILLTHQPAFGILDKTRDAYDRPGVSYGCRDLAAAVDRVRPRLHVFGHIHDSVGREEQEGTTFVNAAILGRSGTGNRAIVVDL